MRLVRDTIHLDQTFPLSLFPVTVRPKGEVPEEMHWHDYYEITLVEGGSGTYFAEGTTYRMNKGDLIVFNRDEPHGWVSVNGEMCLVVLIFFDQLITDSDQKMDAQYLSALNNVGIRFQNRIPGDSDYADAIRGIFLEMYGEWTGRQAGYRLMVKADLMRLLTLLARHFPAEGEESPAGPVPGRTHGYDAIGSALRYLDIHYAEQISLADIAAVCGMSPAYFSTCFHRVTGENFVSYLTRIRVRRASALLSTTDQPVSQIAFSCGFNNMSTYYRACRKYARQFAGTESGEKPASESGNAAGEKA